jgi:predicted nuclease of predicted toxin-antitoxin system
VLALAHAANRLLLTDDKDFGELVFRQGRPVPGVVLLRLAPDSSITRLARLQVAIDQFGGSLFGR